MGGMRNPKERIMSSRPVQATLFEKVLLVFKANRFSVDTIGPMFRRICYKELFGKWFIIYAEYGLCEDGFNDQ